MVGAKVLDIFSMVGQYNKLVKYRREAMPHLTTACTESNITIREK